ncbi:MAG: HAD family hydrolase [Pseudomonadota bacterium]|nr:HAD family hydrolase [Pseudomonadota bacterium]
MTFASILPKIRSLRKALFLDRDGVINVDVGHTHRRESIVFIDGIFDLCRAARSMEYLLIVVTNQSGIGRGYFSEDDFHTLMRWMQDRFAQEGAPLDAVYFCPHHPEHGLGVYKQESQDRKPGPGMILRAQQEHGIDLRRSILIGDKDTDMQAAAGAGIGKSLLLAATASPQYGTVSSLRAAMPFFKP